MGNLTSTETELLDEIRHLRQDVIDLENRVADYQGLSFSADAVRESERLHRVTISSISDSVFITDDEGDFTYVCPNCHVIFGHTREIVLRNRNISYLLGEGLFALDDLLDKEEIANIERHVLDAYGRQHDLLVTVKRVDIQGGTVLYTCRDFTERKQLQDELQRLNENLALEVEQQTRQIRESQQKYRRLVEGLKDEYFFFTNDNQGVIRYVSPSVTHILGYAPQEMIGNPWRKFADVEHPLNERIMALAEKRLAGRDVGPFEAVVGHSDGASRILEIRDSPLFDDEGSVVAIEGIAKDITARRQAETDLRAAHDQLERRVAERTAEIEAVNRQLRKKETLYRNVVEDQTEMIVRWLPDGTRTFVNGAYCRYFAQTREELLGTSFAPLIVEEDLPKFKQAIGTLSVANPVVVHEHRVRRPDGSVAWHRWTDRAIYGEQQELVEYQSVGRDVTALKEAEQHARDRAIAAARIESLSPRERDVLAHVVDGDANKIIARRLDLSIKTVEKHRSSLMKKLHVRSLPELVKLAMLAELDRSLE